MRTHRSNAISHVRFLWVALSLAVVATLILVACGGTSTQPTAPTPPPPTKAQFTPTPTLSTPVAVMNVKIVQRGGQFAFDPATLAVKVGTQVVWTNVSDAPNTVTSDTGAFNTPDNLEKNETFKVTFTKPGTYTYYCNIHTYMKGTVVVTA